MSSQRLVLTVFVFLGPALAAVAAPTERRTVSPSGGDDTAAVQAALDDCPPGCVVALEAGTFRIAQLVASDFRGEVRGQGRGVTVLEALPALPVNDALPWPWAVAPTPATPWPVLIAFLNGRFSVSDLTVRVPASPATELWFNQGNPFRELIAVMVTGDHADARFERVDVEGAPGTYFGRNLIFGIAYEGILAVTPGQPTVQPQRPIGGSFTASHCAMRWASLGTLLFHVRDLHADVSHNTIEDVDIGYFLNEAAATDARFTHNSGSAQDTAVRWMQGVVLDYAGPSRLEISHNRFEVRDGGVRATADGIELRDGGTTRTATAEVLDNQLTLRPSLPPSGMPVRGGLFITGLRAPVVRGNHIEGPAPSGILLAGTDSAEVRDNHVQGVTANGIAVTAGSGHSDVTGNHVHDSGAFDLRWDGSGIGNAFTKNHCASSDPDGLCTRP